MSYLTVLTGVYCSIVTFPVKIVNILHCLHTISETTAQQNMQSTCKTSLADLQKQTLHSKLF